MRWILLLLTVTVIAITVEALRWKLNVRNIPFHTISRLWRVGLDHLSLEERQHLRERYGSMSWGIGGVVWVLAVLAAVLVVATVREFLR